MTTPDGLEPQIQEIGKRLFAAMSIEGRRTMSPLSGLTGGRAVQRRLLEKAAEDRHFKTQLFRFIDVYPSLRDSGDLMRHMRAYLAGLEDLPRPLDRIVGAPGTRKLPSWVVPRLTDRVMTRMVKNLIAARDTAEVFSELKRLRRQHTAFTLDILGEACLSEAEAAEFLHRYSEVLETLPPKVVRWAADPLLDEAPWGEVPRVNLSIKLSTFYSQIDPADMEGSRAALVGTLKPLFVKAREKGAFLNIDLERFAHRDLTYAVFSDLALDPELVDYPHLGTVVQAYLRDAERDARNLVELARRRGTPITVRLVKGAYRDYEVLTARQEHWPVPVFTRKAETDAQFERLAALLVDNWETTRPALGTHNIRSIAAALAAAEVAGLPPRTVEIQTLYGMADPVRRAAVAERYRVREYVAVGDVLPGMAYLVRRLLDTTQEDSFLRLTSTPPLDVERLLAPPETSPEIGQEAVPAETEAVSTQPAETEATAEVSPPPFRNEPRLDFSRPEARAAMEKALTTIRGSLGREYALVIGGAQVRTDEKITSLNPARPDEVVGVVAAAGPGHVDQALTAAVEAFPGWRDTPASERAAALLRAAAIMRGQRYELAALEVVEAGKPWREADADVTEAIDFLEYYAREMRRLSTVRGLSDIPGETDLYLYEPRGVAAVVAPWNFPLAIPTGMVSAALVAGNSVIFKPASTTPVIGYALVRILHEAGVPGGAVNFLSGPGGVVGDRLAADPRVDLIAFTGSLEVGTSLIQQAATVVPGQRNIKRIIAEMGGKNAIIVDTDADLDAAVEGVLISAFNYAGQKCSACSRVIVLEDIYDRFVRRLTQAAASLTVGDPLDPAVRVGPAISAEARAHILSYIEKGKSEASLILPEGGEPVTFRPVARETAIAPEDPATDKPAEEAAGAPGSAEPAEEVPPVAGPMPESAEENAPKVAPEPTVGYFIPPHIFVDVPPGATVAQEEIFGPVLTVFKAVKFGEALELALGVRYALTGGLYSRNPIHINRAMHEFRVGNLYINRPITGAMVGRQPFGGSRMSGVGSKAGGPDYLLQFMEPRTITENTMRRGLVP